jgi:hypothetical protein
VSTFTALEVAPRWRVSPEVAEEFLHDMQVAGLVAPVEARWQVTEAGFRLSAALGIWKPDQAVDGSRPARHRGARVVAR